MTDVAKMAMANRILEIRTGSQLYGTATPESDEDFSGIFVPSMDYYFGLLEVKEADLGVKSKKEDGKNDKDAIDRKLYALKKFCQLARQNNPNILETLFADDKNVIFCNDLGRRLLKHRHLFPSKDLFRGFIGYAHSQRHKMVVKSENIHALNDAYEFLLKADDHVVMAEFKVLDLPFFQDKGKHIKCGDLHFEASVWAKKARKIIKTRLDKATHRAGGILKYGFDCYDQQKTEFLTDSGWKRYEQISDNDLLASVVMDTGKLQYEKPTARISKVYTGDMYLVEPYLSKCLITPTHGMAVSPCRRSKKTGFSLEYFPDKANWRVTPFQDLLEGYRSAFHFRRVPEPREEEYDVEDEYLMLAGMFISEGTINFKKGEVKTARICQTPNGDGRFFSAADSLMDFFNLKRYTYTHADQRETEETIWTTPRSLAERIYSDFGHKKDKTLPDWCMKLSYRQCEILWKHACYGDGTTTTADNEEVYYSSLYSLVSRMQAALVSSGHVAVVRGPYASVGSFSKIPSNSYQIYRPFDQKRVNALHVKPSMVRDFGPPTDKKGYPIKRLKVENRLVCCFEVPSGTLVTRFEGRPVVHGNCKFACNLVRLLLEGEELLNTGEISFPLKNADEILAIKRGEWKIEDILEYSDVVEARCEIAHENSKLPSTPNFKAINDLVIGITTDFLGI